MLLVLCYFPHHFYGSFNSFAIMKNFFTSALSVLGLVSSVAAAPSPQVNVPYNYPVSTYTKVNVWK